MGFLSPWFLAGLAAVGLPLYVHLLRQHKNTPLHWSSLMFFEQRTQSSIKHRRLKYLALLALRAALLVLLVLAFSSPFVSVRAGARSGAPLLLVVVDNSLSMRAGDRLAQARRIAGEVLGRRKPGDKAQVAALGFQLRMLTQPVNDAGELRAAVESIKASDSFASYGEFVRAPEMLSSDMDYSVVYGQDEMMADVKADAFLPLFVQPHNSARFTCSQQTLSLEFVNFPNIDGPLEFKRLR